MIRYALACQACEAEFEAWFASSGAYDRQAADRLVACPFCGSCETAKQVMAPAVCNTRQTEPSTDETARKAISAARRHLAEHFDHVGPRFAQEARAMHAGTVDSRPIWGQATREEAESLQADGVPAAPLPDALVPPTPKSPDEVN